MWSLRKTVEMPTAETGPSAELVDMTRRFWIGSAAEGVIACCTYIVTIMMMTST